MPLMKAFRTLILLILPVAICASSLWAADKDANDKAKQAFASNCKTCHGVDGAGTPVGQSLNAPDLRSEAIHKQSDSQLAAAVSDGKGNMPPFKNSLTPDQIQSLVRYVRHLAAAKAPAPK
jgi:mono/diheme cytochrome c family protein